MNINEMERCRADGESKLLELANELLSNGFVMLSKLFADHLTIRRECVLTSFSLVPSVQKLQELESFVVCDSIVPKPSSVLEAEPDVGVVPAYYSAIENLNMEESVKLDLNTILRYRRSPSLSWELEWSQLKANCEHYMETFGPRSLDDEVALKYLELDYNAFKDIPQQECTGIEKGYEQFMEPTFAAPDEDESTLSSSSSSSSSSSDDDPDFDAEYAKKRKCMKKKNKKIVPQRKLRSANTSWDELSDWKSWLNLTNDRGDTKLVFRRQKRQTWFVASSDSEMQASKKRCTETPERTRSVSPKPIREFEICIPRLDEPVHGKRVTMQIRVKKVEDTVESTDDDDNNNNNNNDDVQVNDELWKPCEVRLERITMSDIASYTSSANEAVRSLVGASISSPTAVCSCPSSQKNTIEPIVIRRQVKEVISGGKRKKKKKKTRTIFEIITKDPTPEKSCHFHSV
jgi:hypothetical protein